MREQIYELVYAVMEEGKHSDAIYHSILERDRLSGQEAAAIKREAYGTIERTVFLDAMIRRFSDRPVRKMDADVRTLLRIGFYELEFMDSIPVYASCDEIQSLTEDSGKRGFINAVMRGYVREQENPPLEDPWKRLEPHEKYAIPRDLWDVLVNGYGKKTTARMARYFLERQGEVTLHIDPNKISVSEYAALLSVPYEPGRYMKDTLILHGSPDIASLPGYEEGYFYVQDEGSQLPVAVAGIRPGDQVVDVCGAPGGKSVHALMCLKGDGVVSIRDLSERKLSRIRENMARMRFMNAEIKLWDGREEDPSWRGKADVVLCDVPCSGYGIIGRKPELRFRSPTQVGELVQIQRDIVRASVSMLKDGGVLIYSTCTIHPAENEENALWIEEELGLMPESLDPFLSASLISQQTARGRLQVLPGVQQMDGFFVARFRKI
ncbi:MAG: 16S rRNA (cytosine(967)-C(5))-methyltransferase RsmB [Eubacterium sp.]|nr:16S rRNA (cytosine(967)-C(5))-methyltransferase RsmB [Eubacterium sp.]